MHKTAGLLIALALALTLTACAGEDHPRAPDGPAPTAPQGPSNDGRRLIVSASDDTERDFATLTAALEAVQPGDTISIQPGIYPEVVELYEFGSDETPTTIRGEGTVIFDGQRSAAIGFLCDVCTNLIVENITFRHFTDVGIAILDSRSVYVHEVTAHNNGFAAQLRSWEVEGYGILVDNAWGVIVADSVAYENGPNPKTARHPMGTGIDVYGCYDCQILRNQVHHNTGGTLIEDSGNVLYEGNEVWENDVNATDVSDWWDAALWVDGGHDIIVRNNIFRDNQGPGLQISNEDDQTITGYVVENNVITGNYVGLYVWGFGTDDLPPDDILRLGDNDISRNRDADRWIKAGWCPPPDASCPDA